MSSPLVSIITVVYNGAQHIEQAIKSVLGQDYSNIEYILIDGGSTDGTTDIIKKYQEEIAYWVSEKEKMD
jgi:glycosyltransferase involved in cell wall biosynthesis